MLVGWLFWTIKHANKWLVTSNCHFNATFRPSQASSGIYIYMHTYIRTYIHTCIYIHTYIYIYIHTCIPVQWYMLYMVYGLPILVSSKLEMLKVCTYVLYRMIVPWEMLSWRCRHQREMKRWNHWDKHWRWLNSSNWSDENHEQWVSQSSSVLHPYT